MPRPNSVNWAPGTSPESVTEIVRLAEDQLQDALAMAIAADQRAITQANMLAAIAVALLVASTGLAALAHHDTVSVIFLVVSALGFLIAAAVSMHAAKPVDYYPRGFQPAKLGPCADDYHQLQRWVAEDLQDRITRNRRILSRTAELTTRAHIIAIVSALAPIALNVFMHTAT